MRRKKGQEMEKEARKTRKRNTQEKEEAEGKRQK